MTFFSLNPKYDKIIRFFHILGVLGGGGGGALRQTQVNENFRAVRPHNRADKFITRETRQLGRPRSPANRFRN